MRRPASTLFSDVPVEPRVDPAHGDRLRVREIIAVVTAGSARIRAEVGALVRRSLRIAEDRPPGRARSASRTASEPPKLAALVYELLDAHHDTAQLATQLEYDPVWDAHLHYLRALQRKGRDVLAHEPAENVA